MKKQIDELDGFKPFVVRTIKKNLSPEQIADKVIEFFQKQLIKVLDTIFHKDKKK